MVNDKDFETLLKKNDIKTSERWYPQPVSTYQEALKLDYSIDNCNALSKNLAYSLQYLEFLEKEIDELALSSVLMTLLIKTYIIIGMSILEGIFVNIVKSHGWWKRTTLESLGTTTANETRFGAEKYVIRSEILKKVPEYDLQMDLNSLIQVLSHHHDALKIHHDIYPALRRLKNLRNRVHLQMIESSTDHDYNAFGYSDKIEMGAILYEILTSSMVSRNPKAFAFLEKNTNLTE